MMTEWYMGMLRRMTIARRAARMRQSDIAKTLDVAVITVHRWEAGKNPVPTDKLDAIARAYKCQLGWLVTGEGTAPDAVPPPVYFAQDVYDGKVRPVSSNPFPLTTDKLYRLIEVDEEGDMVEVKAKKLPRRVIRKRRKPVPQYNNSNVSSVFGDVFMDEVTEKYVVDEDDDDFDYEYEQD